MAVGGGRCRRHSCAPLLIALLSTLNHGYNVMGLESLTNIQPLPIELAAFAATVVGALEKLDLHNSPVVHIIGASSVEDLVDYAPVCQTGATVVMVGPQAISHTPTSETDCVTVINGMYDESTLGLAASPDIIILHNADIYMEYWRRTLAKLLQMGKPVVVTMYCEFEGSKLERIFKWSELEFTKAIIGKCDALVQRLFGNSPPTTEVGKVPEPRTLWRFEENPYAHASPKNCYSNTEHGIRNSYWIAFTGAAAVVPGVNDEL